MRQNERFPIKFENELATISEEDTNWVIYRAGIIVRLSMLTNAFQVDFITIERDGAAILLTGRLLTDDEWIGRDRCFDYHLQNGTLMRSRLPLYSKESPYVPDNIPSLNVKAQQFIAALVNPKVDGTKLYQSLQAHGFSVEGIKFEVNYSGGVMAVYPDGLPVPAAKLLLASRP